MTYEDEKRGEGHASKELLDRLDGIEMLQEPLDADIFITREVAKNLKRLFLSSP